jgi:alpha 1,6-mannosyltransferase
LNFLFFILGYKIHFDMFRSTRKTSIAAVIIFLALFILCGGGWRHHHSGDIPKKIWYKLGPKGLNDETRNWIDSCLEKNPEYQHEFLTDETGDAFVKKNFISRPDIVQAFLALNIPIAKADFLCFLVLYAKGGIYSDLDVSCEDTPIREWIPEKYKKNVSLVVGWSFDTHSLREFATSMVLAKPRSRHMLRVLNDITSSLDEKAAENNVSISAMTMDNIGDVVWLTGPRSFTRSVLRSLEVEDYEAMVSGDKSPPTWEPRLINDVLILPGWSFSLRLNRYWPQNKAGLPLATHHFAGTWKNKHGGEQA